MKKAYLLATPQREYYVRYPPGFGTYLRMKHGHLPFDPDKFLLRVVKNCYGARDAGVLWYNLLASFLMSIMDFTRCALDRCVFVRKKLVDGI